VTEIALCFKAVPHALFRQPLVPSVFALEIQPDEGIALKFNSKEPGPQMQIQPVNMEFRYGTAFGQDPPDAYERLILDAMLGDSTLFIRRDEVEASWRFVDVLTGAWRENGGAALPQFTAGTWGPAEADELLARGGRKWRRL
jgi:glucose-6-phosphate 1-dehydrogenase